MKKIILDLCGGTGAWSKPWEEAGYDVRVITLPDYDITETEIGQGQLVFSNKQTMETMIVDCSEVCGILAAPPCTMFSFARTNAKKPRDLREGMKTVIGCLNVIWECQSNLEKDTQKKPALKFWVLENPNAMLRWFLGEPTFLFHPWEFGDNYKKKTALWGNFNFPKKLYEETNEVMTKEEIEQAKTNSKKLPKFDKLKTKEIHAEYYGKFDRQTRRSITPQGFARAFFEANGLSLRNKSDEAK